MLLLDRGRAVAAIAEQPGCWGLLTSAQLAGLGQEPSQALYADCRAVATWLAAHPNTPHSYVICDNGSRPWPAGNRVCSCFGCWHSVEPFQHQREND